MTTDAKESQPAKARWPFRIGAALITYLAASHAWSAMSRLQDGDALAVLGLLSGLLFAMEFGSVALRGDGLLHRADRYCGSNQP